MLKYFTFKATAAGGYCLIKKEETVKEINKYAEENDLKIIQVSVCDNGIYVVFEKIERFFA